MLLILLFFELPLLLMDLRSLHNLHLLVRSPKSQASKCSCSRGRAFSTSLKSTGRHSGCEYKCVTMSQQGTIQTILRGCTLPAIQQNLKAKGMEPKVAQLVISEV